MTYRPDSLTNIGSGWHALVQPLIDQCQQEGALILQIKEKFGGLRFYIDGGSENLMAAIDAAENRSYELCEECGQPGVPREGGWTRTLCDDHAGDKIQSTHLLRINTV